MSILVKSLIRLCKTGKITLADVPIKWREAVEKAIMTKINEIEE